MECKFYSLDEFRNLMGVSRPTAVKYLQENQIDWLKLGDRYFISKESVGLWLEFKMDHAERS